MRPLALDDEFFASVGEAEAHGYSRSRFSLIFGSGRAIDCEFREGGPHSIATNPSPLEEAYNLPP